MCIRDSINVLVFTCMLTEERINSGSTSCVIDNFSIILKHCKKLNVYIIACQKVVDTSIKLNLQREGILLLDRMGTQLTEALVELSGALPISDISLCLKRNLQTMIGTVKNIGYISCNYKAYVSLENKRSNIVTLLVHCSNIAEQVEIKVRLHIIFFFLSCV